MTTSLNSFRYYPKGFLFDATGHSAFPKSVIDRNIILGYCNSLFVNELTKILNPTMHFHVGYFNLLPFPKALFDNDVSERLFKLVEHSIDISIMDWNAKETSWDFNNNELIRLRNDDYFELEVTYDLYQQYWKNIFFQLYSNEETLNKIINDKLGLHNEIRATICVENVTILQDELDRKALTKLNKKLIRDTLTSTVQSYHEIPLPFVSSKIVAQFISYSVGCMFGRYSLNKEGLVLANQGETLQNYLQKTNISNEDCTFLPDADNIIPFLEEEWFEDDIVGKFHNFLRVSFGEKNFNKNLAFIEEQLGKDIRKYFIKDFYPDHIKRYKKRPIYWMFSSPNDSFNILIYMHRYTPDTVSNILNKYLKEFIGKLNTRKEHLQYVQVTGSASDKAKALKEFDSIEKMLVELHEYERDILYPLATERIEIDLDDGVLVNYNKFGKAVKEINGLNDPATKKKVKQFDWIDTSQIR